MSFLGYHGPAVEQQRRVDAGHRPRLLWETFLILRRHPPDRLHWKQGWYGELAILTELGQPHSRRRKHNGKTRAHVRSLLSVQSFFPESATRCRFRLSAS